MPVHPDNATNWRDLADQLTPEQVTQLEATAIEVDELQASMFAPRREARETMLRRAQELATENMLAALIGDIPVPAGVSHVDAWQDDNPQPYRFVRSADHVVLDAAEIIAEVRTGGMQLADGSIDTRECPPSIDVAILTDDRLTAKQARALATLLTDAADQIDRWSR